MKIAGLLLFCASLASAQVATTRQMATWRQQIRAQLYVPAHLPPLEARTWSSFSPMPGVVAERVTYRTAAGMLVPAIVYRPAKLHTRLPGIVIVNGHGGDKFSWYAYYSGLLLAQAGAMVVTYDPIGEGERNVNRLSRAGSHDVVPSGVDADEWGRRLAGLMQVDLMQAVAYLRQRQELDPARIGVVGYSMGAFVSGIAGAIDPDIHAVLLSGGGTYDDSADGGKPFDESKLPCQGPPWRSLLVLGAERHQRGAVLYALNAARGPMLVENGSADGVMGMPLRGPEWFADLRAQAIALRGTGKDMFTTHVDQGKDHRTAWVERPGMLWLEQQLHFANWTGQDIQTMPVTRVNAWIQATGWDVTANYKREDREGGLMALGTGFPGATREQLTVLPDADWQRLQGQLTFEDWEARTKAAMLARKR